MNPFEQSRYNNLYQQHLRALKLQGMSDKTIDAYACAGLPNTSIVAPTI